MATTSSAPTIARIHQAVREILTYLRNEACSNNLADFGLKKGLDHLAAVREKLLAVTGRFAAFQAQWLNVHVEFPLLQRLALPIAVARQSIPASKSTTLA